MKAKYVVYDRGGIELMIIFSGLERHDEMTRGIRWPVVSAGFIEWYDGELYCGGKSESLGIDSRPQDVVLAEQILSPMETR